jgi:hypothetical protein
VALKQIWDFLIILCVIQFWIDKKISENILGKTFSWISRGVFWKIGFCVPKKFKNDFSENENFPKIDKVGCIKKSIILGYYLKSKYTVVTKGTQRGVLFIYKNFFGGAFCYEEYFIFEISIKCSVFLETSRTLSKKKGSPLRGAIFQVF